MQFDKANELRKDWKKAGNKPCDHPHTEKEYYLSAQTGDHVCTTCGATVDESLVKERQAAREAEILGNKSE